VEDSGSGSCYFLHISRRSGVLVLFLGLCLTSGKIGRYIYTGLVGGGLFDFSICTISCAQCTDVFTLVLILGKKLTDAWGLHSR